MWTTGKRYYATTLEPIQNDYQFIFIDCPPALDLLTLNALMAADSVLIPIQCEFFALEGVSGLMDTIDRVRDSFDHPLQIEGILLTMYDERTNLTRQVATDLREFFQDEVFKTVIPRSVRLAEAPSHGKPILIYDPARVVPKLISNWQKRYSQMNKNDPRRALGKGLHSLLPSRAVQEQAKPAPSPVSPPLASSVPGRDSNVQSLSIEQVTANPDQPRREFDETALLELSQSIERDGIIQPLLVRKREANQYQIIAGERRFRAAKLAGLKEVPVIVREANDEKVLELAIIENIQREDLNPIELALAFQRMAIELGLSHEQIGLKTGKQRVTITNSLRLLQLPEDVQQLVVTGQLSPGHARALLKLEDDQIRRDVAARCVKEGWSVRQIEDFTRPAVVASAAAARPKPEPPPVDPNVKFAIEEMERTLGTRVRSTRERQ